MDREEKDLILLITCECCPDRFHAYRDVIDCLDLRLWMDDTEWCERVCAVRIYKCLLSPLHSGSDCQQADVIGKTLSYVTLAYPH